MSQSAVRELQAAAGAAFGPEGRPESFGNINAEIRAARQAVALFDLTGTAVLEVGGPDAADYLHRMLTCAVKDMSAGESRHGTALKGDGRMIADVFVRRGEAQLFHVLAPAVCRKPLVAHLEKFLIMEDVAIADLTDKRAVFAMWGPRTGSPDALISDLLESGMEIPEEYGKDAFFVPVALSRIPSYVVVVPEELAPQVWRWLVERTVSFGGLAAGERARQVLRVEEGTPEFGIDMDETTIPLEAGLKESIDFRKGCFPGQEIVARIENLGHPAKVLVGLTFRASAPPEIGGELFRDGKSVGKITSVADSPTVGARIGLGYVKWDQREPHTELVLGAPESADRAIVTQRPTVGEFV